MEVSELVGYAAMLFVGISIAMKDIKKLRVWNLIGAITFVVYGVLIKANPVILLNLMLTIFNIYYLVKLKKEKALDV